MSWEVEHSPLVLGSPQASLCICEPLVSLRTFPPQLSIHLRRYLPLISCPDLALALSFRPLLSQSQKGSAFVCFCCCDHHNMCHETSEKSYLTCWTSESDLGLTELSPGTGNGEFRSGSARKEFVSCVFRFLEAPFLCPQSSNSGLSPRHIASLHLFVQPLPSLTLTLPSFFLLRILCNLHNPPRSEKKREQNRTKTLYLLSPMQPGLAAHSISGDL
uniref:Uncharacterized protein n=1 Tax=Myotis myotis TaxID=51298 RepID=A0A7J7WW89_MYOMY|nr:hypothetical protein mMyoMyo1_011969 [Myotis myotis]